MLNWLGGGKPTSALPEPTPLELQRSKQINQLKKFLHNVSEIQRDLEYRINFYLHNQTFSLLITLPPRFPADKPMVKVSPAVKHPWVDEMMLVNGSKSINNFSVHSDLGKAIKEVLDEFERNPPVVLSQQLGNASRFSPYTVPGGYGSPYTSHFSNQVQMPTLPPSYPTSLTYRSPSPVLQTTAEVSGGYYKMPEIPVALSDLRKLSVKELKSLLNNEERIGELVSDSPQIKQLYDDMEKLTELNERLARDNLTKKPLLEDKKRNILEKYDQMNEMRDMFNTDARKQDDLLNGYNTQILQDRLRIAASQAEEESESLAEQLLEGKMSLETFKKDYMTVRTLSHLRKAKEEKIHTLMLQSRNT